MSSEWPVVLIDDIKAVRTGSIAIGPFGSRMKSDCYVSEGIRVVRGTNLTGGRSFSGDFVFITLGKAQELNSANLSPNDLVFPHRGAIGEVGIVPNDGERYVLSSSLMKLSCDVSRVHPDFVYYFFKSEAGRFELLKNSSQVGTPGIGQPLTSLKQIKLKLPPVGEQEQIAATLRALDNRIALLRETNATLEAIAQALFKSWFVDFDPVRAKQQGLAPASMDEATAALFPDGFEVSRRGLIPRDWREASIYDLAHVIYGAPFASGKFNTEGIGRPLIRIRDLRDEAPGVHTLENHPKGYLVKPGDIVVGMDGEFRAYLWGGEQAWLNQRVCVFAPKANVPAAFLRSTLEPQLAHIEATETATTVIHLGKGDIDRFVALLPPAAVLSAFSEVVDPHYARIVANKQTCRTLSALRDTLLPRLISGQLRLPEAHALVEEVA